MGNPILAFMPTSSFGCLIFDALIAVWFLAGVPSLTGRRPQVHAEAGNQPIRQDSTASLANKRVRVHLLDLLGFRVYRALLIVDGN